MDGGFHKEMPMLEIYKLKGIIDLINCAEAGKPLYHWSDQNRDNYTGS